MTYKAIVVKLPQNISEQEWLDVAAYAFKFRHDMTASHDTMLSILRSGTNDSFVKVAFPERQPDIGRLIESAGYRWEPIFSTAPPTFQFAMTAWPVSGRQVVTQPFGARPEYYRQFNYPGHEGIDLRAPIGTPVLSVAAGKVSEISSSGNYGNHVRINHDDGFQTVYAHLSSISAKPGQAVSAGTQIGLSGNSGNSEAAHLHFSLRRPGFVFVDPAGTAWPNSIFDPTPFLDPLLSSAPPTIDILPFLRGDDQFSFDMGHPDGTQNVRIVHLSPTDWLYVKGNRGEYEHLGLRYYQGEPWIFRFEDTSEGMVDGRQRFYAHFLSKDGPMGAPWLPQLAVPGRWYVTPKYVRHFDLDSCEPLDHGQVSDKLQVTSWARPVVYPQSLARLDSVITVEWDGKEQYDFSPGRGCVAFRNDQRSFWFIGPTPGRKPEMIRKPPCFDLGW